MKKIEMPDGFTNSYRAELEDETKLWRVVQTRSDGDSVSHNGLAPRYPTKEAAEAAIAKFTF